MGPRYRAPRNPTRSQTSSAKTVQTWHYILGKQLTALNDINALRARGSVYCSSRVKALCTIRGIGVNFASVLTREVFYRTFDNRRQIASYLGLAPTPFQSGGMDRDRRINRAGNSRARKTLVQLAWLWLRYQPESSHAAWFRDRVGSLQGRIRRITIVALARKLLIAIWRFVTLGLAPEGAIIAA